jgi:hypothetical protein
LSSVSIYWLLVYISGSATKSWIISMMKKRKGCK